MGLTISYTLSTGQKLPELLVRKLTEQTAKLAQAIGCLAVDGPDPGGPDHWKLRKLRDGSITCDALSASAGWSVMVLPGEGSEPANFGLCRYPGINGWKLSCACKTQYAARHGINHFLACHRRVISLLDLWRDFGVDMKVCDEGEYWQTRSLEQLRRRVATYDRLVAGVAGSLKDEADSHGSAVQAKIFNDQRFELLEAEGRIEFAGQLDELRAQIRRGDES
jgi:hypothetical protein